MQIISTFLQIPGNVIWLSGVNATLWLVTMSRRQERTYGKSCGVYIQETLTIVRWRENVLYLQKRTPRRFQTHKKWASWTLHMLHRDIAYILNTLSINITKSFHMLSSPITYYLYPIRPNCEKYTDTHTAQQMPDEQNADVQSLCTRSPKAFHLLSVCAGVAIVVSLWCVSTGSVASRHIVQWLNRSERTVVPEAMVLMGYVGTMQWGSGVCRLDEGALGRMG